MKGPIHRLINFEKDAKLALHMTLVALTQKNQLASLHFSNHAAWRLSSQVGHLGTGKAHLRCRRSTILPKSICRLIPSSNGNSLQSKDFV